MRPEPCSCDRALAAFYDQARGKGMIVSLLMNTFAAHLRHRLERQLRHTSHV